MSAYTDTTGRVWHGCASAADVEASVAQERREQLGAAIRAHLACYGAQSALAVTCGVSAACISDVVHGRKGASGELVNRIAAALAVDDATRDQWCALAHRVEPGLLRALLSQPERWGDVRAALARGTK